MRLHSSVSRPRGRLVGLELGVFVGLLILLMVATIACDNTEPLLEPASIQESTDTSAPMPTPDGTDVSQSPSPNIDPASREAEGYAAHHGVSLEQAQNRFTLQRLAGELNAVLSDREGRTFAGLWIEHTPQFRVVVQFTRDAQETIARHIQNDDLAEVLEVRTADVSLAELREAQSAAMEAIGSANIPIESGIDIKAGRVKVYVAERDRLDDEIERGRVTLPDNVDLVTVPAMGQNEADGPESSTGPHFLQLREQSMVMEALHVGELVLENGCLRSRDVGGDSRLLIWPPRFKLTVDGGDIRVSDDSGVSLSVGEKIGFGGGEVPLAHVQTLVEQPVPDDCPGPYWVVGEVPIPTGAQESSSAVAQIQQQPTPTSTPSPKLPGSITPVPASERYRLDLGGDVVVAFVEGLSPEHSGKVAYVTHVPSGSQLVLDRDGRTVDRHDGRGDGPSRLDAAVSDPLAMERIMQRLQNDEDARPREMVANWVHSVQFGGITYIARWMVVGPETISRENDLTEEDLGPELYRVAFRIDGYGGSFHQDGDATYLNPGTPVYVVKGYSQEFRT